MKRSLGIWIYGITFCIFGLAFLSWALLLFWAGYEHKFEELYSLFFGFFVYLLIPILLFMLAGFFTLILRFRMLIIAILIIPILFSLGWVIYYNYFEFVTVFGLFELTKILLTDIRSLIVPIAMLGNALFFISAIYFFTRPKVKEQFLGK